MPSGKKTLILGATGPLGVAIVQAALKAEHHVTIFARNPSKLPNDISENPEVTVVKGELTDTDTLFPLVTKVDCIISALGPVTIHHKGTPIADFYRILLPHLNTLSHPPQIIAMGTLSISSPHDKSSFLVSLLVFLIRLMAHGAYKEIVTLGRVFETEGKGLNWTVYRVAHLGTGEGNGMAWAGYVGDEGWTTSSPRSDIAKWLVGEVGMDTWVKKFPAVFAAK